jgi:integrase
MLPVWLTYFSTGLRRNQVVELRFPDIDFSRRLTNVNPRFDKASEAREIPISDELFDYYVAARDAAEKRRPVPGSTPKQTEQQLRNFSKDHVFVSEANTPLRNNLLRQFYATCKRAGIEGGWQNGSVDIHAMRVTFITLSIENGGSPKAVQKIVGHSSLEMTMNTYCKTTDKSNRDAVNAIPFADVSSPEYIIPMHNAHKVRTKASANVERQQKRG